MNSIREYEDENTIFNQICLERQLAKYIYIIVEGDFDEKIFSKLLTDDCRIHIANGKEILDKSLKKLDESKIEKCFAIRDRDYDILICKEFEDNDNIIFTDYKDLEMCIIESNALSDILKLYSINSTVDKVKEVLLKTTLPLGYLRWLNDKEKLD